jgi:hypothetical protein
MDTFAGASRPTPSLRRPSATTASHGRNSIACGPWDSLIDTPEAGGVIFSQGSRFGGLVIGRSGAEQVVDDYRGDAPWAFIGGTIKRVMINVGGEPFEALAAEARAAFAHQ